MLAHEFKFQFSKTYLILLMTVVVLSLLIVLSLQINGWLALLGCICVLTYGAHIIYKFGLLKSNTSILSVCVDENGQWTLRTRNKIFMAKLLGDSTVTNIVSVLRFRVAEKFLPLSCIIFKDSLKSDQYRKLLVVLKGN